MIIQTRNLCRDYGSGEAIVKAVKDINIGIEKGKITGIVGPSGSGKSTLLHLLGGLDKPTSGEVLFEGESIYSMEDAPLSEFRRKRYGFIFQSFHLIPTLTAEENIRMPILLGKEPPNDAHLKELYSLLGIQDRLRHLPGQLSGGQQQRVAIARALATKPDILFADEPTGNLDQKSGDEVLALLTQAVRLNGQTLIIITHDPRIAAKADNTIEIIDGEASERRG